MQQILIDLREAGLTQVYISKATGIAQPTLSKWERHAPDTAVNALKLKSFADKFFAGRAQEAQQ